MLFNRIKSIGCIFLLCVSMHGFAQNAVSDLKQLMSGLKNTFSAEFTQKSSKEGQALTQVSGEMVIAPPGRFYWHSKGLLEQKLIADGTYLWVFDVGLDQAVRYRLSDYSVSTPASLLTSTSDEIAKQYYVNTTAKNTFTLIPKNKEATIQQITLVFDQAMLSRLEFLDQLGGLNQFVFTHGKVRSNIPKKLFLFSPPKGIDVIRR